MAQHPSEGGDDTRADTPPGRGETKGSLAPALQATARAPVPPRAFVGRFEVVRLLGRGGFGVVYEARDTELGRHVALKLMRTDRLGATDRTALLEMFRAEAATAATLNHPNVVTIHDFGTDGGAPYLVLELLIGETLAQRIAKGPLLPGEAIAILTEICRGLVHERTERCASIGPTDAVRPHWCSAFDGGHVPRGFFLSDGRRILTYSTYGGQAVRIFPAGAPPGVQEFRPRGRGGHGENDRVVNVDATLLFTTSTDGTARILPIDGGAGLDLRVPRSIGVPHSVVFAADGRRVAAVFGPKFVLVWPVAGGDPLILTMEGVQGLAFSRDGTLLAVLTVDGLTAASQIVVLRSDGSGEVARLTNVPVDRARMVFAPDGSWLLVAGTRGLLFRTDQWHAPPTVLQDVSKPGIVTAAFNPQGTMIVAGSADNTVQFWSLDGHELAQLRRVGGPFVAVSPDGQHIAAGRADGTVRISHLEGSGDPLVLHAGSGAASSVAFTPDGRRVVTLSDGDPTVRLWLFEWSDLVAALKAATTACLSAEQRTTYLEEGLDQARAKWEACERRHGRL